MTTPRTSRRLSFKAPEFDENALDVTQSAKKAPRSASKVVEEELVAPAPKDLDDVSKSPRKSAPLKAANTPKKTPKKSSADECDVSVKKNECDVSAKKNASAKAAPAACDTQAAACDKQATACDKQTTCVKAAPASATKKVAPASATKVAPTSATKKKNDGCAPTTAKKNHRVSFSCLDKPEKPVAPELAASPPKATVTYVSARKNESPAAKRVDRSPPASAVTEMGLLGLPSSAFLCIAAAVLAAVVGFMFLTSAPAEARAAPVEALSTEFLESVLEVAKAARFRLEETLDTSHRIGSATYEAHIQDIAAI
ncbi:hypothetical protein M885DRAFT_615194 [Pelagophyceae sp. CCMP2097]|nr:hypothetical protein M885DRAFT_615194 [Pelagophyceae sp. CCMP2097]